MVHALKEIHRVLRPGGKMIDLRPVADRWPIELLSDTDSEVFGQLVDLPAVLADDAACEVALGQARSNAWFALEEVKVFEFPYLWDSPDELKAYRDENWQDYHDLPADEFERLEKSFESTTSNARIGIRRTMHLGCWQKL
jgi:SAM-dependent methyltransferase